VSVTSPCVQAAALPADACLESFYAYRAVPAGQSSIALGLALDARRRRLDEVTQLLRRSELNPDQADEYRSRVLTEMGVTAAHQTRWRTQWNLSTTAENSGPDSARVAAKLGMLQRYLTESTDLYDLAAAITTGHENFQRRELGLALAAYARAESWFARMRATGLVSSIEPNFGDASVPAVKGWYQTARPALAGAAFLDHLQTALDDLPGFLLTPWQVTAGLTPETEAFRKHLYELRNIVLPLCRHDCHLELGDFCSALAELLRVRNRPGYLTALDPAAEAVLAGDGPALPVAPEGTLDPARWATIPENLVHQIERRLVDLKMSDLMRAWGEYHERRADPRQPDHPDTLAASARYAQVVRVQFQGWSAMRDQPAEPVTAFRERLRTAVPGTVINPIALEHAETAMVGLSRLRAGLNFLGFSADFVPSGTYRFLLGSARYLAEQARQLERDALQFLTSAEAELGNQRLLVQHIGAAASQLAVETRRTEEAAAGLATAHAAIQLAQLRRVNSEDRIRKWEAAAPTLRLLGVIGGAIGGAGSGASLAQLAAKEKQDSSALTGTGVTLGLIWGALSSYLSSSNEQEMHADDLARQAAELLSAEQVARAERARAEIAADIVRLTMRQAAANLVAAQSNLEFATTKTLSADFWFAAARRLRQFASRYLEAAIRLAFLTEQALEFQVGRRFDRIRFDYAAAEDRLAADALLLDLNGMEAERVLAQEQRGRPIRHVLPLRIRDFWAFEELKRTGRLRFETTVRELDLAYPGTFLHRLVEVELEVRALAPPTGILGTLTKSGLSLLRFPHGAGLGGTANVAADWINHTPTGYRVAPVMQADQTVVLSTFDVRRDAAVLRSQEADEQLRPFEGSGPGCSWELRLDQAGGDLDLRTITDVNLVLYLQARYDPALAQAVELERRKLLALGRFPTERTKGYSFAGSLPDPWYQLLNPGPDPAARLERTVAFDVVDLEFPAGEVAQRLRTVVVAFLGLNGPLPVRFSISSAAHSPSYDRDRDNREALAFEPSTAATTDPAAPNVSAFTAFAQPPADRWFLRMRADDNPSLAVAGPDGTPQRFKLRADGGLVLDAAGRPVPADPTDPPERTRLLLDEDRLTATLVDVWWVLRYRYQPAGRGGEPLPLWTGTDLRPRFPAADGTVATGDWIDQDVSILPNLRRVGFAVPPGPADGGPGPWGDLRVRAGVILDPPTATGGGVLARHRTEPGNRRFGYRLRLGGRQDGTGADVVDALLERFAGDTVTELARRDGLTLPLDTAYEVELTCQGSALTATLADAILFDVRDPAPLPPGGVALWGDGRGNTVVTAASFTEVSVSDLTGRP